MKYVRSSHIQHHRNVMAVHIDEQVYYKAIRDIQPREEMLLYARDVLYPDMDLDAMAMHKITEDNQTYPCNSCGELFKSKVALRRHETYGCLKNPGNPAYLLRMTALDSQQIGDSDGKSMDSETSCVEPENGIEGEFKCDQCPKSFQWKSNLSRHQITHDEDKRYPCENCDKVFTDPSNLQRHIRSQHVGARCHACSDCGKTFATSSGLKQHQHIHSSVKPFQCEVCLKAYTQFSNLCRHKRMHADCRQQIKCKDCGQAFSTVTSLTKHRRFCEGIRSGMRGLCYPPHAAAADKLSLAAALSPPGSQGLPPPPPHGFGPAAFVNMNLYGARPYHPFFTPPLGGHAFPLLQPSLPPGLLGPASLSPSGSLGSNGMASDSPPERDGPRSRSPTSEEDDDRMAHREDVEEMTYRLHKREADKVEMSDDDEFQSRPHKKVKREPGEITPTRCRSPAFRARKGRSASPPGRTTPPPSHCIKIAQNPALLATPTKEEPGLQANMPFDLSVKAERKSPLASQAARKTPSPSASAAATDGPLDLSVTKKSPKSAPSSSSSSSNCGGSGIVTISTPSSDTSYHHNSNNGDSNAYIRSKKEEAEESKVSASAFSKSPVVPEPKYPFPSLGFPFPGAPRFMENFMRSQAMDSGKELSLAAAGYPEELSKFLFPRFGLLPGAFPPGFNPLHLLRHDMGKALGGQSLNPLLKMDKPGLGSEIPGGGHHLPMPVPVSLPHHVPYPYGPPAMSAGTPAGGNAGGSASTPAGVVGGAGPGGVGNKSKERYSCKFCGKIFPRSANLTRHLRTHTGEQPYKCKYCDRSFSISSNLQRHVRNIHNKEKPFRCPLCDRSFGQQTNLDRHLKKHEQEGPNVTDSPTAELDGRDDPASYYHEIRSLFARNLDPSAAAAPVAVGGGGVGSAALASTDAAAAAAPLSLLSPRPALPRGDGALSDDAEDEKQSDVTVVDEAEEDDIVDEDVAEDDEEEEEGEGEDLVVTEGREGCESRVTGGKATEPPLEGVMGQELDLVVRRDVSKAPLRGPSAMEDQTAERTDGGEAERRESRQQQLRAPGQGGSPCDSQAS